MSIIIQHRRDTASNWTSNNPTMSAGQIGVETDTGKFKIGDGSTAWSSLDYFETATPSGPTYTFGGSTSGYTSGGYVPGTNEVNIIDKFPFSSDANATDVGDLTVARYGTSGQHSSSSGYTSGGRVSAGDPVCNIIDKFPFASDGNATDVGNLTVARTYSSGQMSETHGYAVGGRCGTTNTDSCNIIDKFSFSSDGNATDVGDSTVVAAMRAGQSMATHGYSSGGIPSPNPSGAAGTNVIEKFPFSSDANATDVGDLTLARWGVSGQSSSTHGYTSGGYDENTGAYGDIVNVIDKFPFSSDANATDVGDTTTQKLHAAGTSSTASGYNSGGTVAGNVIEKFSFSSDANATDVGDITPSSGRCEVSGTHV